MYYDLDKIRRAYDFAEKCHSGQKRISGEPYITHPIAVAQIVADLQLDTDSICAALLHDTVEDCGDKADISIIRKSFGNEVANLVDGVTKLVHIPFEKKQDESIENLRKMFLAMSKDLRVIFIKLADRLHNMRTLEYRSEQKQRSIALETMHVYAPLAHRLGIQMIKQELETLALRYLDPVGYDEISRSIEQRLSENEGFLQNAKETIAESLTEQKISYRLEGRVKSIYSIYRKMYNQNKPFDEIYDFYAIRIIVKTEMECYSVLGVIHEKFKSMPGRFKDYISTPKANMYRSLHTTVIGHDGIPFEVQIRTEEMHEVAEYGLAAHWKYKSGEQAKELVDKKLKWIRTLLETEKDPDDADEFFRPLKIDLFDDETFVFTPQGDVVSLPAGSNPIDFAYAIHSAVGNKMVGAKVNGNIVPIDYVLENGQIVEILTSSASKGPSRDWLKMVRSGEAR
ncbi:MAG: bifunctional (p)ppGpp synthetase/guanosine-3',5'-bis(diphosphate) 3'-pyrophosphohydrolase, partial [Clostridia bacterium]|nr:bifunctional (p)ppGpp synthetase/guanosine-3',5'-bis(diphosphate) 3'-pyrophosphohydrolase [Clostridia bacterium]